MDIVDSLTNKILHQLTSSGVLSSYIFFVGAFILSVPQFGIDDVLGEQVNEIHTCPTRASLDFCWKEDKYDDDGQAHVRP